jgi:hypothetical protein
MQEGAGYVGGFLCAQVIGIPMGALIGAVFLRAAVALYNTMAGGALSPGSVPEPAFGKALGITLVGSLVSGVVNFIGFATGVSKGVDLVVLLIAGPVSLLIMAAMLSALLPTTFGRAILVALCYALVAIVVLGALGIALVLVGMALRGV